MLIYGLYTVASAPEKETAVWIVSTLRRPVAMTVDARTGAGALSCISPTQCAQGREGSARYQGKLFFMFPPSFIFDCFLVLAIVPLTLGFKLNTYIKAVLLSKNAGDCPRG